MTKKQVLQGNRNKDDNTTSTSLNKQNNNTTKTKPADVYTTQSNKRKRQEPTNVPEQQSDLTKIFHEIKEEFGYIESTETSIETPLDIRLQICKDVKEMLFKEDYDDKPQHEKIPILNLHQTFTTLKQVTCNNSTHIPRPHDGSEMPLPGKLNNLTPSESKELNRNLNEYEFNQDIVRKLNNKTWVTKGSMITLKPNQRLNDEVINFFFQLMQQKFENSLFFNTYFYQILTNPNETGYNFNKVRKWNRSVDKTSVFEMKQLFIPCNITYNHWTCVVVTLEHKTIDYYDSLRNDMNSTVSNKIQMYLNDLKQEILLNEDHKNHEVQQWTLRNNFSHNGSVPLQNNATDCGVYMCVYVYCIAHNIPFHFDYDDIATLRERITFSIMKCNLYEPFWYRTRLET